jgi:DNA-binding LacI/PurR family transcriptional regulator
MSLTRRRRRTTIGDVARLAGVSNGAVSLAFHGQAGVADSTRQRIIAAADELGWRPSIGARALLSSRAFAVGLILARDPELLGADPFFPSFIAGVESELAGRGYSLVLQVVPDERDAVTAAYRRVAQEGRVDGVFLADLRRGDPRLPLVEELGLPAVAVGRPAERTGVPVVAIDDRGGVRQAVEHLIELGHRRIAFVGGPPGYVHSASRASAWRQALRGSHLTAGPVETGDFTGDGGAAAMSRLLARPERPTAVVFANDLMAIAGMSVAVQAGIDVPADLSIIGFDDVPLAAHVHPPLTTVRQDVIAWGRASAAALLSVVEDGALRVTPLPPSQLVLRASTAPVRGHGRRVD